jgi:hypothetical protein
MTNLTLLRDIITNSIMGSVFGDPILTGIVILALGLAVLIKLRIPMDAALVIIVPTILLFGGYMLLPAELIILVWLGLGLLMAMIFIALFKG